MAIKGVATLLACSGWDVRVVRIVMVDRVCKVGRVAWL